MHELQHLAWGGLSSLDIRRSAAEDVVPRLLLVGSPLSSPPPSLLPNYTKRQTPDTPLSSFPSQLLVQWCHTLTMLHGITYLYNCI